MSRSPDSGWPARGHLRPGPVALRGLPTLFLALLLTGAAAPPVQAQDQGWNSPAALDLIARARALRQLARGDSTFSGYAASARGYVYFYLDRPGQNDPTLVRTDQVALDVYWKAPDSTHQQIIGLRDEERLPTDIRYHMDHLTVVQDEFQDLIRLGDGDEVAAVRHPASAGSEGIYDFRVADSVTISFAGPQGSIRVYELDVRPKDYAAPGFVGSLFVARSDAAIVRMNFTFTPASYVDDYLDYIRISLDNSLWDGKYWLPYEQRVELRREIPFVDFPVGSVIRGRYRIRGYEFNPEFPPYLFLASPVSVRPRAELEAFPFERSIYEELDEEGLRPVPELAEIRAEAARMIGARYLSGLSGTRLWAPAASDVLRYNRAEGLTFGLGGSFVPAGLVRLRTYGGYAFGRRKPLLRAELASPDGRGRLHVTGFLNRPVDLGPTSTASGIVNTLGGALNEVDYTDLFFESGGAIGLVAFADERTRVQLTATAARQRSGHNVVRDDGVGEASDLGRPVPGIEEGTSVGGRIELERQLARRLGSALRFDVVRLNDRTYGAGQADLVAERTWLERGWDLRAQATAGWTSRSAPPQALALFGGRGTVPGHGYRESVGDRFALLRAEGVRDVRLPWVRIAVTAAAGRAWLREPVQVSGWPATDTDGTRFSAGLGARLFWDTVRLDVARGLNGGGWEVTFAAARRFRPWL